MESSGLRSEQNYIKFAQQVGDVLYEGQTPYNIPSFFTELSRGLSSVDLSSLEMKKSLIALLWSSTRKWPRRRNATVVARIKESRSPKSQAERV